MGVARNQLKLYLRRRRLVIDHATVDALAMAFVEVAVGQTPTTQPTGLFTLRKRLAKARRSHSLPEHFWFVPNFSVTIFVHRISHCVDSKVI